MIRKPFRIFLFFSFIIVFLAQSIPNSFATNRITVQTAARENQARILNNVKVIQLGESVRLILLSDEIFYPGSANLRDYSVSRLQAISYWISAYHPTWVKISVYTDTQKNCDHAWGRVLTDQQAHALVDFFSGTALETRLLYGIGYAGRNPVDDNANRISRRNNRRIEISFNFSVA